MKKMRPSPRFVTRRISGRTVLLPLAAGEDGRWIFELNETADFVWARLGAESAGLTEDELAAELEREFDADPESIRRDLRELIEELGSVGAIA